MAAQASSAEATPELPIRYDVFISFRGEDTRLSFISHLYRALSAAGIRTFKDDNELWAGDRIQPTLVEAIRGSKISVVVLSSRYADSRWCLDELVEIITSRQAAGQRVIPVFYDVDPLEVRFQVGAFKEAFRKYKQRLEPDGSLNAKTVHKWRTALTEVVALKGVSLSEYSGDEGRLIKYLRRGTEDLLEDLKQMDVPSEDSLPPQTWEYRVFLCFRGADTRKTFTSHLYNALTDAGITAFLDLDKLPLGEEITPSILTAVRSCRISVVVLSRSFAGSRWCLQELAEMMILEKNMGGTVIPVFYHVDPGDVRKQHGTFSEVFADEQALPLSTWKAALRRVGNLSGHVIGGAGSSDDEATIVQRIVDQVSKKLKHQGDLHVATFPVGLDSRVEDINPYISVDSGGVRLIGVLGMGGTGKTTLAKAIWNRFHHPFEAKCFLADIRTNYSERSKDKVHLQEQLLNDVLGYKTHQIKVSSVPEGISTIKTSLRNQKVFIVLDDVSTSEQVRTLVGECDFFGSGSRVIVTTRYEDLLGEIRVHSTYNAQTLNDDDSLKLFCRNAFGDLGPKEPFVKLAGEVVKYCKGVPLALELLGRALSTKSEVEYWTATIKGLETYLDRGLHSNLRVSYDALGDDVRLKNLFLDIACYFVGCDKDYVVRILKASDPSAEKKIGDLKGRCLLEVDKNNKLMMHQMLRDMGREIAHEKSPDNPGKRRNLWLPREVLDTLESGSGTTEVEGLALELGCDNVEKVSAEAFTNMKRLKLLKLDNVQIEGEYKNISKQLRWLCWHHFSPNFIPDDFDMRKLVAIDMQYSSLKEVWKDNKVRLENLKILKLSTRSF